MYRYLIEQISRSHRRTSLRRSFIRLAISRFARSSARRASTSVDDATSTFGWQRRRRRHRRGGIERYRVGEWDKERKRAIWHTRSFEVLPSFFDNRCSRDSTTIGTLDFSVHRWRPYASPRSLTQFPKIILGTWSSTVSLFLLRLVDDLRSKKHELCVCDASIVLACHSCASIFLSTSSVPTIIQWFSYKF